MKKNDDDSGKGAVRLFLTIALATLTLAAVGLSQIHFTEDDWWLVAIMLISTLALFAALARLALQCRLHQSKLRWDLYLKQGLEATSRAYLLVDEQGQEIIRNEAAKVFFGASDNILGPITARSADNERVSWDLNRLQEASARRISHHCETPLITTGGAFQEWVSISVMPLSLGGTMWLGEDISARRAIDDVIRHENEMLSDFVSFLPVGFYSADASGRIRYVNQRLAEWLGRKPEELVGKELKDVLGSTPNPEGDRFDMRIKGRNDEIFQAFVIHSVFDEGGETLTRSVVVRDLMSERNLERLLRVTERRLRWLFDDAPVGIVLIEPDGSIMKCNKAFSLMTDKGIGELHETLVTDYIAPEDRAQATEHIARAHMGDGPASTSLSVRMGSEGAIKTATLHVARGEEDGAIFGVTLHFIDTTEQHDLEIQFTQSQKMQAIGQLAGGVAHDFNNLLTAMIGFCDLLFLRHGPGDPSFADLMQIKQNANRAASLVRQLLAFSRRQALQPRLLDITEALADLSSLLRRLLGETIELRMNYARDAGAVRVDPGQFDQVIINLAVNARDAMPGGGVLSISTWTVSITEPRLLGADTMPSGEYVVVEIADTGTGIPRENLERIFEPFFSTKPVGAGTGLGLSTVYGILRQTDGFIFVESQPGEGACFRIYLPWFELKEVESASHALHIDSAVRSDLTGKGCILIVEDEDAVRLFGARALKNKGYKVLEASSGEAALDVLRENNDIDVLVTDVVMPGMDGATLARLVHIERPKIRVILMSGYSEDVALSDFLNEDGVYFLPKPFSLAQLAGKVKEAFEKKS